MLNFLLVLVGESCSLLTGKGLKIPRLYGHAGSTPAPGTSRTYNQIRRNEKALRNQGLFLLVCLGMSARIYWHLRLWECLQLAPPCCSSARVSSGTLIGRKSTWRR